MSCSFRTSLKNVRHYDIGADLGHQTWCKQTRSKEVIIRKHRKVDGENGTRSGAGHSSSAVAV